MVDTTTKSFWLFWRQRGYTEWTEMLGRVCWICHKNFRYIKCGKGLWLQGVQTRDISGDHEPFCGETLYTYLILASENICTNFAWCFRSSKTRMFQNLQGLPCLSENTWLQQKARQYRQVSHATVETTIIWGSGWSVGWQTCPAASWHGMGMFAILITQSHCRLDWIFCTLKLLFFITQEESIMKYDWYCNAEVCLAWGDQICTYCSCTESSSLSEFDTYKTLMLLLITFIIKLLARLKFLAVRFSELVEDELWFIYSYRSITQTTH